MRVSNILRVALLICACAGVGASIARAADDYPSRPVTIAVPYTPGGTTDVLARYAADVLQRALHQSFVVENRPGAGGAVGIGYVAKATPDGYTIGNLPTSSVLLPHLMKSLPYDPADLTPIGLIGLTEFCLVVSPSLDVNSVADLIALAKAKPGVLTYASAGIGTPHHLLAELFKSMTHVDLRHIPYKGTAPGLTDLLSNNVSVEFVDVGPALPLVRAGKLKLLAVTMPQRLPDLPDVPTVGETVPGYEGFGWQGLQARAGTPAPIVEALDAPLIADLKRPETAERFRALGVLPRWSTPDEFRAFIAGESAKWGNVIRAAGIEPE